MDTFSTSPSERARKSHAAVLQALSRPGTQVAIATAMGISETQVSRMKNEQLEQICVLLAHAGMKVVSNDKVCVNREAYESMSYIASKAMADRDISKRLIWEDE
ncbi:MAG TPA: hypothetical protein DCF63_09890 [Planctomycetaceae bacterium]|nr:hypothetical protein [Planctomycetaceae bacterium]